MQYREIAYSDIHIWGEVKMREKETLLLEEGRSKNTIQGGVI